VRTFVDSKIDIIFADTDREFRNLIVAEGIKNREVRIKLLFVNATVAAGLTVFTGNIYNWNPMGGMKFKIGCEQKSKNLKNIYPNKVVTVTDYPNTDESSLGQLIPVPYGAISADGLSGDGAFPCILVDPTTNFEKHLVGLQAYIEEIINGGFDSDTTGWTAIAGHGSISSVAGGQVGNCLKILNDTGLNKQPGADSSFSSPLTVGRIYELSFYIKDDGIMTENIGIQLLGGTPRWLPVAIDSTNAWVKHTVTFEALTANTGISFQALAVMSDTHFYMLDEVILTEVIGIDRVYVDKGVAKVLDTDYTVVYRIIGTKVHAEIHWEIGAVRPTAQNIVSCDIQFGSRSPCEAWKHFLINFCGHVAGDFHAASYNAAYVIEQARGYGFDGAFIVEKELIAHEDQIKNEFELDIWRDPKDGLIHFKYISAVIIPTVHYEDYVDILKGYEPNIQVGKIINYLKYGYNYNYARTYFNDLPYKEDTDSQTKYGAIYRDQQNFYFVRDEAIALDLAGRKLLRRKDPIVLDKFVLPIKAFNDNLGDFIEITHFEGKGASGYRKRAFQIRTTQDNLDNFTRKETLEDISNYVGMAFIMGPDDLPTHDAASAAQKEKYGFLCDPITGLQANGEQGKRLSG